MLHHNMSDTFLRHWPILQSGSADGSNSSATRWARQYLSRARTGNIARASSSRPIPGLRSFPPGLFATQGPANGERGESFLSREASMSD